MKTVAPQLFSWSVPQTDRKARAALNLESAQVRRPGKAASNIQILKNKLDDNF